MLDFSIVIPTAGDLRSLQRCLESLRKQKEIDGKFEILLIANPEWPELSEWACAVDFANCRILVSNPPGAARARNLGLREAKGNIVFFLDDDCELIDALHLSRRLEWHRSHPDVAMLGGFYASPGNLSFWGRCYNEVTRLWLQKGMAGKNDADFFLGGNLSLQLSPRSRLLKFPEQETRGGEETWFRHQARELGLACHISPDFDVDHFNRHDMQSLFRRAWQHGQVARPSGSERSSLGSLQLFLRARFKFWPVLMIYSGLVFSGRIIRMLKAFAFTSREQGS